MALHTIMMALSLASGSAADRTEIAFFDVETSAPERCALLEFGAILVCPRTLVEVTCYSTFVRPVDIDAAIPATAARYNGITQETIAGARPFRDVADAIYDILHGECCMPVQGLIMCGVNGTPPFCFYYVS